MDPSFREALPADIEELIAIRGHTRENSISKRQLASLGISAESVAASMLSGRVKAWVCLDDSKLVAFCMGDWETGEVLVLAVLPDFERRGIGASLLHRVVRWLGSSGPRTIWLAATPDARLRAHGFYRSLGWRPNGGRAPNGDEILVLEVEKTLTGLNGQSSRLTSGR